MADMLSNPAIAQTMNEALNNPAFVDYMIQSNPMLQNMPNARELINSPYFRTMMTNPEAIRIAARMRRMMGGNGTSAFPAPGATDTTPAGAPASGSNPGLPLFPGLFGPDMFGGAGGAGAGAGAANPFAALFGAPQEATPASGNAGPTTETASPPAGGATATAGQDARDQTSPPANPAANPAANPFAALFGGVPQGGQAAAGANPFGISPEALQQMMQMFGGPGPAIPASPPDNRPPEERYADQLRQLNDMGFYDFDRNIAALRRSGGSVQGAIEHLLGG
jgi:ubiquilin